MSNLSHCSTKVWTILVVLAVMGGITTGTYTVPFNISRTRMCPPQLQGGLWNIRAQEYCGTGVRSSLYHCVQEQVDGYTELCIQPQIVPKGYYMLWSDTVKRLYKLPCPRDRYQETDMYSNMFYQCEKKKSLCDEPGMLEGDCDTGNTTHDRLCQCDYKNSYVADTYAFLNPLNKTCFNSHLTLGGCTWIPCDEGQIMNEAYRCINCPEGYVPDMSMECVPITFSPSSVSTTKDYATTPGMSTTTLTVVEVSSKKMDMQNAMSTARIIVTTSFVSVISVVTLVVIVVTVYYLRKRYRRRKAVGEKLRKTKEEVKPVKGQSMLEDSNIQHAVGLIYLKSNGGESHGTGFLVGDDMVMTAYHVVEEYFEWMWQIIWERLSNKLNEISSQDDEVLKIVHLAVEAEMHSDGFDLTPEGKKCIEMVKPSSLFKKLEKIGLQTDGIKQAIKHRPGRNNDNEKYFYIVFGLLDKFQKDNSSNRTFPFSWNRKFISIKKDVAILRLLERDGNLKSLKLCDDEKIFKEEFCMFGFPKHEEDGLQVDAECFVLEKAAVSDIKEKGKVHFNKMLRAKGLPSVKKKDIERDYDIDTRKNRHFFHCSPSMVHGASGSPCVVHYYDLDINKIYPVVISMLIKGHPRFIYHLLADDRGKFSFKSVEPHLGKLVEEGVSMLEVKKLLQKHDETLYEKLFHPSDRILCEGIPKLEMNDNRFVRIGVPFEISCKITGNHAEHSLTWEKCGRNQSDKFVKIQVESGDVGVPLADGGVLYRLRINNPKKEDICIYRCTVLLHKHPFSATTSVEEAEDQHGGAAGEHDTSV